MLPRLCNENKQMLQNHYIQLIVLIIWYTGSFKGTVVFLGFFKNNHTGVISLMQ